MKKILFLMLFLVSCTIKQDRGFYFVDKSKIENFDVYNFTKQDLIDNIGYPSIELEEDVWLYYSYETENFNFLKPKLKNEVILLVYFDDQDNIKNFYLYNKENTKNLTNIKIEKREEDKKNILKQLFDDVQITPTI